MTRTVTDFGLFEAQSRKLIDVRKTSPHAVFKRVDFVLESLWLAAIYGRPAALTGLVIIGRHSDLCCVLQANAAQARANPDLYPVTAVFELGACHGGKRSASRPEWAMGQGFESGAIGSRRQRPAYGCDVHSFRQEQAIIHPDNFAGCQCGSYQPEGKPAAISRSHCGGDKKSEAVGPRPVPLGGKRKQ
jgi:hypothetical protein